MSFKPGFKPPNTVEASAFWFVFKDGRLLFKMAKGSLKIPETKDLAGYYDASIHRQYIGKLNGRHCYAADIEDASMAADGLELKDLRSIFGTMEEEIIWTAGRANQLATWNRNHQFCGRCGDPCADKQDERAKICPSCGLINYPRLSPAVIVAVLRGDRILLARNKRFKMPFFSVLAGFVEPGETLEGCILREIEEEVGIAVDNIRYFGSQPWPFPDSLMVAFLADYAGGEIQVDGSEITEAKWFSREDLPNIPPNISIARRLIDWFTVNNC
ncbi:MAG: NAD(+) diphosphatase [Deltaproteobacteria bacterium]|nr:NAD(+) diphosphatase [Deltaproteobacteria bacterium]MBW2611362.1 NAD(+) diphosphatase [Deltaproteobacteria bacterium]MBW2677334.1 NAD(+) diphosphatase [Deltaproteobacteria bacterium]